MADNIAPIAQEFLDLHFPNGAIPKYKSEFHQSRLIYEFIAKRYPKWELSPVTVKQFTWTLAMISPRCDVP